MDSVAGMVKEENAEAEHYGYAPAIVPKLISKEYHVYSADYAIYTFWAGSNLFFAVKHNGKSTWTH